MNPRISMELKRLSLSTKAAVLVTIAAVCTAPWWWGPLKRFMVAHEQSFWIDVFLGTALLAIIPFALAAYGGHLAAETISDPVRQRNAKLKFWGLCLLGVIVAFAQQYRSFVEADKSSEKISHAQEQIIKLLGDLHSNQGIMTEAERRKKILDALREKFILTHDVDQNMIDGIEAPPFDWVNAQLESLGENWTVSAPPKTTIASKHPQTPIPLIPPLIDPLLSDAYRELGICRDFFSRSDQRKAATTPIQEDQRRLRDLPMDTPLSATASKNIRDQIIREEGKFSAQETQVWQKAYGDEFESVYRRMLEASTTSLSQMPLYPQIQAPPANSLPAIKENCQYLGTFLIPTYSANKAKQQ